MTGSPFRHAWCLQTTLVMLSLCGQVGADVVDFARDVRPILSEHCFHCHGPDAEQRRAGLRLDTPDGATQDRGGYAAVVAGDPGGSELIRRIHAASEGDRMPPAAAHRPLTTAQKEVLSSWIEQGAHWSAHWAFTSPGVPDLPQVSDPGWPRNPIDTFILARLDREGLRPAPPASDENLLRRVSLDLNGLPPSPEEREQFLQSSAPDRWERVIERLLDSPRFGERMAWPWLDAARYADSNGYQGDRDRSAWPWRDWVVRALNDGLPFDEFTVWQLAGDLLAEPTEEQRLATAFLRNHMINGEGGRIAEENRAEYIFDQLETVATVWLGMTMNCCRCHDHKYDPLTNRNYYELFAFFNQTPVTGDGDDPQSPPTLAVPDAQQRSRIEALEERIAETEARLDRRALELEPARAAWEARTLAEVRRDPWRVLRPIRVAARVQELTVLDDGSVLASGHNPANDTYEITVSPPPTPFAALRIEALRDERMTDGGMARSDTGDFVITAVTVRELTVRELAGESSSAIEIRAAVASVEPEGFPVRNILDDDPSTGWSVWQGAPIARDHQVLLHFAEPVDVEPGGSLLIVLRHDSQHEHHNLGRFRLSVTELPSPRLEEERQRLAELLALAREERTEEQSTLLLAELLGADELHGELARQLDEATNELDAVRERVPRVMVMAEQAAPRRKTYVLQTGLYNRPGEEVEARLPAVLPALPQGVEADRLSLARWLVAPENPLTARVTVNRLWAEIFGEGLVSTPENFGVQGAPPSHPELLDWLATELVRSGWDLKHVVELIVNSATYRQSSAVTPELLERDPENALLARGPRFRMPSWMIRDQALYVSGLLVERTGGAGVRPYQPPGVWREFTFGKRTYEQDQGDALYRRSLYTFWRRIVAPSMFFDSASRQACSVSARRTNTPLHALATLNDTTYVEASRVLGERVLSEPVADDRARIRRAFLFALCREPVEEELELLATTLRRLREQYARDPSAAEALVTVGQCPRAASLEAVELAAWTGLCLALLNSDEALTKE